MIPETALQMALDTSIPSTVYRESGPAKPGVPRCVKPVASYTAPSTAPAAPSAAFAPAQPGIAGSPTEAILCMPHGPAPIDAAPAFPPLPAPFGAVGPFSPVHPSRPFGGSFGHLGGHLDRPCGPFESPGGHCGPPCTFAGAPGGPFSLSSPGPFQPQPQAMAPGPLPVDGLEPGGFDLRGRSAWLPGCSSCAAPALAAAQRGAPGEAPPPSCIQAAEAVKLMDACLRRASSIGDAVERCIRPPQAARGGAAACEPQYFSLRGVAALAPAVAQELGLPAWLFGGLEQQRDRFDFNQEGLVDDSELKRIFKITIKQKWLELGGSRDAEVPTLNMEEAGFTIVRRLGRGGHATMYLCAKRSAFSTQQYCLKFYDKRRADTCAADILDEYATLAGLDDRHVMKTHQVFQDQGFVYIVHEPYFGGDLTQLGRAAHDGGVRMSERWWRGIFRHCLEGLRYLHGRAVLHGDVKEPNIVIASRESYLKPLPVFVDFGHTSMGVIGTPGYIPPETWQTGHWYPRGDVFSLGVVFFQLVTGLVPSKLGTLRGALQPPSALAGDLKDAALNQPLPWDRFPATMPGLRDLVGCMTQRERACRPCTRQLLGHPWLSSKSDADLPLECVRGLVATARSQSDQEELLAQLGAANSLFDLRALLKLFRETDRAGQGAVDVRTALQVLAPQGTSTSGLVQKAVAANGGTFKYSAFLSEAIATKEQYCYQYSKGLFDRFDAGKSGVVTAKSVRRILRDPAFQCTAQCIDHLLTWMDADGDGLVDLEDFIHVVLDYGRIMLHRQARAGHTVC